MRRRKGLDSVAAITKTSPCYQHCTSTAQSQPQHPRVIHAVSTTNPKHNPIPPNVKKINSAPARTSMASQIPGASAASHQTLFLPESYTVHSSCGIKLCLSGSGHKMHCPNTKLILVWQYFSGYILILSKLPSPRKNASLGTSLCLQISYMHLLCKAVYEYHMLLLVVTSKDVFLRSQLILILSNLLPFWKEYLEY